MKLPDYNQRKTIIERMAHELETNFPTEELNSISENFTLKNFALFYSRLCLSLDLSPHFILETASNIANKTLKQNRTYPKFEHLGGLDAVKQLIRDTFEVPQKFAFLFKNLPIKMSSGVLLYGPPGCGKTFIAAATANELGMFLGHFNI